MQSSVLHGNRGAWWQALRDWWSPPPPGPPIPLSASMAHDTADRVMPVAPLGSPRAAVLTDRGCLREVNEDNVLLEETPERGLLVVVADGMGGSAAGETASSLAVETVRKRYFVYPEADANAALRAAVEAANSAIFTQARESKELAGMGTTCVAVAVVEGAVHAASVGDSRIYLARGDSMYQLNQDQSVVGDMVRRGILSREQARQHEERNVITQALGTKPQVEVASFEQPLPLRGGDRLVLCTDGLFDLVEEDEILLSVLQSEPEAACRELVEMARGRGGYDNISVAVVLIPGAVEAVESREAATEP